MVSSLTRVASVKSARPDSVTQSVTNITFAGMATGLNFSGSTAAGYGAPPAPSYGAPAPAPAPSYNAAPAPSYNSFAKSRTVKKLYHDEN